MRKTGNELDLEKTALIDYKERAEFYDIECSQKDDHGFISSLITPDVEQILEIPCGTGRNTFVLADSARRVTAVDMEPAMTKYLEKRIEDLGIYSNITVLNGDMRTLDLDDTFDLIIIQREAFQLITEKDDALKALKILGRHLNPQGCMVVDLATFHNGSKKESYLHPGYFDPTTSDGQLVKEWVRHTGNGKCIERSRIQNRITDSILSVVFYYKITLPTGTQKKYSAQIELRCYSYMEFNDMAIRSNLKASQVYRNYTGASYGAGAVRMIFLLQPQN